MARVADVIIQGGEDPQDAISSYVIFLILTSHFPEKIPMISSHVAEKDLQFKVIFLRRAL